ncbi:CpaE family protein [Paenibacillus chartarius]|uniref:CpaE family protein n=1 Tax=Paenibacillus chartarius TaxID=747481 RepID=A0ABV6DPW5_9BACL
MNKLELILLDDDADYVQGVRDYVRARDDGGMIEIKVFSKPDAALAALRQAHDCGVLLAAERLWPHGDKGEGPVVLLLESLTDTGRLPTGVHYAFRYLPLDQLMQTVRRALTASGNNSRHAFAGKASDGRSRVITWFSAGGGSGKSTAAYNLAMRLAQQGEDVCLVSLESLPSALWMKREISPRMAEWLYYAKAKPHTAIERIGELIRPGLYRHLYYTDAFAHPDDAADMSAEDAELLLNALKKSNRFAWIIVDLEAGWSGRNRGALQGSDRIMWIVTDDAGALHKTEAMLELWRADGVIDKFAGRLSFIAGKYVGLTPTGYDRIGIDPSGVLPYVPQWKMVKHPEELLKAAFYTQTLWEAFQGIAQVPERSAATWNDPS